MKSPFPRLPSVGCLLEKANGGACHAGEISLAVRRECGEQILRGFLGQVRLLQDTLGRVHVRQIQSGSRVARVEYGRQSHTGTQRAYHNVVHVVVNNMSSTLIIYWVDHVVEAVVLVTIQIGGPTTMAGEVNEERVVRLGILDQPVHGSNDIILGWNAHGILLVVGENDHILATITEALV